MYRELLGTSALSPFQPLITSNLLQWVPQLKYSGLSVLFLAPRRLLFPGRSEMRATGTRLCVGHSRSWALMLYSEAMHNISVRLGRMDVRERAICRLLLLFNVWEKRLAVVVVVRFDYSTLLNGTPLFAFIGKNYSNSGHVPTLTPPHFYYYACRLVKATTKIVTDARPEAGRIKQHLDSDES